MSTQEISLTNLKQNLGEIINHAAFGQERFILLSRGKPRAALISIEDLKRLQALENAKQMSRTLQVQLDLLAEMDLLRAGVTVTTDSVQALHETREERTDEIVGMP